MTCNERGPEAHTQQKHSAGAGVKILYKPIAPQDLERFVMAPQSEP